MVTLTADVVVVGAGPAGMAATAAARADGASLVVVEAGDSIGGNAVRSNGYLAFVGSGMQADHHILDREEAFLADAHRAFEAAAQQFGLVWNVDAIRLFVTESAETYRTLYRRGVRFTHLVPRPEHCIDRILAAEDSAMFARAFAADFVSPNVYTLFGTRVDRLTTEGGRVTGVRAHGLIDGAPVLVRARRGVVLASGGYQANPALRQRYEPGFAARSPYFGLDTCRGDGQVIGAAVGADLINMTFIPPMILAASTVVENAIAVNSAGVRFHDETGVFSDRVDRLRHQPGRLAWYILDDVAARAQSALIDQMPHPRIQVRTISGLADAIAVPAERLADTVARWNAFLASAAPVDAEFGRTALPAGRRGLTTAPFTALAMVEGANFTCGGFRTTTRMQVLDMFGTAIPGLYAAGDTTAGLNAVADMGGLHISGAFTLGCVAGRAAAAGITDATNYGSLQDAAPAIPCCESAQLLEAT